MNTDPNPSDPKVNAVSLTLPPYTPQNPQTWFLQLENLFELHSIKNQKTRYLHASINLPGDVATQVQDILLNPPKDNPYDALKQAVLSRNADSKETRVEQVLSGLELGNRTPSQLLRHMRSLIPDLNLDEHILRQLWIKRLPPDFAPILAFSMDNVALDQLAEMADRVFEYSRASRVHNITHSDPIIKEQTSRRQVEQPFYLKKRQTERLPRQRQHMFLSSHLR